MFTMRCRMIQLPASALSRRLLPQNSSSIRQASSSTPPKTSTSIILSTDNLKLTRDTLFVPPGLDPGSVTEDMVLSGSNIVVGRDTRLTHVKDVEFVKGSMRARDCPRDHRPEFAIVGRSNVGKSSLINALVRRKDVALTSKKPGKTQMINHFLVNKSWFLVDLPGYGFAHVSEDARTDWSSFTKGYFMNRKTLIAVLLLVDSSIPPQKIDLDCANWLGRIDMPLTFVFTKCDKMRAAKGRRPGDNIYSFLEMLKRHYGRDQPPWIMTSSLTGMGRDGLLRYMSHLRNYWNTPASDDDDDDPCV